MSTSGPGPAVRCGVDDPEVTSLLTRHAAATQAYLRDELPKVLDLAAAPPRLAEAVNYSLLAGGKRLRPALVLEAFNACSGSGTPHSLAPLPAAAAVELVHTFSLVHDDLPAMDDDALRRGRPTNHVVYGEALAVLAGDAMTTLAFELLAAAYAPPLAVSLILDLSRAAGPGGMIGGQVLDIAAENKSLSLDALKDVHRRKTGALLTCAARLGGLVAGASAGQLDALTTYGRHLGLAFQIADDLLDVTASPADTGKATNKDAAAGKNTYPSLLGVDQARRAADEESRAAVAALAPLGDAAAGLRALARFAAARSR